MVSYRRRFMPCAMPAKQLAGPIAMLASAGARTSARPNEAGGRHDGGDRGRWFRGGVGELRLGRACHRRVQSRKKLSPPIAADDPPSTDPKDPKAKRLDALGDPLPDGAIMRLGTRRHRVQTGNRCRTASPICRCSPTENFDASIPSRALSSRAWPVPKRLDVVGISPDGRYMLLTNQFIFYSGLRLQGQKEPQQEWQLTLYDLAKRNEVWSSRKMLDQKDWADVNDCRFSADGKWIATAGQRGSGTVRLWDAANGKQIWEHKKRWSIARLARLRGRRETLCRPRQQRRLHLFVRSHHGKEVRSFPTVPIKEYPGGGHLTRTGRKSSLAAGTPSRASGILPAKSSPLWKATRNGRAELAFSPDGKKLYSGSSDSFVLEREWPSGKVLRTIDLGRKGISEMAVSGDGKRLEIIFWGEQAIAFFDLETGKRIPNRSKCIGRRSMALLLRRTVAGNIQPRRHRSHVGRESGQGYRAIQSRTRFERGGLRV